MVAPASLTDALHDRYTLERELGRGGMATVYLANDLRHDRQVALKVLRPDLAAVLGPERFQREIRLAARLQHPHILTVLDSGGSRDVLWFTMPFVEGESLRARLDREGQLPIDQAVRLASEVADALECAHSHGIVHRDIKPENILLSGTAVEGRVPSGQDHALVTDFGIARPLVEQGSDRLTQTGLIVGTPAYMSLEQASGERNLDGRTDVYSLSCVLYEMLVGEPPYTGPTAQAITAKRFSEPVPSARRLRDTLPPALDAALTRGLARSPADRFKTAKEFGDALTAALREPAGRSSTRRPILAALALLLIAVAGVLWDRLTPRQAVSAATTTPINRLAVLPFTDLGGDSSQKYLSDGLTEETISALSHIAGLRVIARTSVMKYQGSAKTVAEIGRELDVGSVLEGSVGRAGDRLRIRVRLVDSRTQEPRWAHDYEAGISDVLAIQQEVAARVAQELSVQPRPSEREQLNKTATVNVDAYDAYLRGLFYRNAAEAGSAADADSAVMFFQRATALDHAFALAHAALARVYIFRLFQYDPDPRWQREAFVEIEKALAIDPNLAEAYVARAELSWTRASGFRAEEAIRDLRRAIALKPNLKEAHGVLGRIYYHVGLLDEALQELRTNLDLDPTDWFPLERIAGTHWAQQKLDTALAEYERLPEEYGSRALILYSLGRGAEALDVLAQGAADPDTSFRASVRAVLLAASGRPAEARQQIRMAERGESLSHFHHAAYNIAGAYALMGEPITAIHWLRRTANEGFPCYPLFAKDRTLDPLRRDPQFIQFMAEMKQRWERFRALP